MATMDRFGLTKEDYIRIWAQSPTLFVEKLESGKMEHTPQLLEAVAEISTGEQYEI